MSINHQHHYHNKLRHAELTAKLDEQNRKKGSIFCPRCKLSITPVNGACPRCGQGFSTSRHSRLKQILSYILALVLIVGCMLFLGYIILFVLF